MKKTKFHIPHSTFQSQDGITMVVAIMLLAGISFASFTLSSIILREIQAGQLIQDSAPAIAGAYSGVEIGLYRLHRNLGSLAVTGGTLSQSGATFDVIPDFFDDPFTFTASGGQALTVSLYDPANLAAIDPGYRRVTITSVSGRRFSAEVVSWGSAGTIVCSNPNISNGQSLNCNLSGPDFRYQITIRVSGSSSGTAVGTIQAFDASGAPLGVPSATPTFDATGKFGVVNHRIRVNLQ